jgi:hypothetical protein
MTTDATGPGAGRTPRRQFLLRTMTADVLITVAATLVLAAVAGQIGIAASVILQSVPCALLVAVSLYRKGLRAQTAGT